MKLFSTSLALTTLVASLAFGDEANVLPNGVARLRLVPSYSIGDKTYDGSSALKDASPAANVTTLSGALEYGITEQITGGLKWAPGYYVSSQFSNMPSTLSSNTKAMMAGPADLELGAKIQVLGPKGFVPNEMFRFALTPGISFPLDKYDGSEEGKNMAYGKDYRPASSSDHGSFGGGIKADFDYLVNSAFYVNLHTQALQYLPNEAQDFATAVGYWKTYKGNIDASAPEATATANAAAAYPLNKTKTTYGLEYTIELEPHYTIDLGNSANIGFGLPIVYAASLQGETEKAGTKTTTDSTSVTTLKPYASAFFLAGPIPIEVQAEYDLPIMGTSESATKTLQVQVKLFYKF